MTEYISTVLMLAQVSVRICFELAAYFHGCVDATRSGWTPDFRKVTNVPKTYMPDRLESVVRRAKMGGFLPDDAPSFRDMAASADSNLFGSIIILVTPI